MPALIETFTSYIPTLITRYLAIDPSPVDKPQQEEHLTRARDILARLDAAYDLSRTRRVLSADPKLSFPIVK